MSRLKSSVLTAFALAVAVLGAAVAPAGVAAGAAVIAPTHPGKSAAVAASTGSMGHGTYGTRAAGGALAGITEKYPCTSATPFGSVLVKPYQWDKHLVNTGHDGANFNVYSNYASGSCDRSWQTPDGTDKWGERYQCAELAIRVADAEWATGTNAAWVKAGWDGSAADMQAPGQALGLTWTANGSGTLPAPGDLMIWSSSGPGDPGHVAVVSAVTSRSVTFVGENQGDGMVTLPVSGATVQNDGWKSGSTIGGWLSYRWKTAAAKLPANAAANGNDYLFSVACPSTSACVAVGYYTDSSSVRQGLIETKSGSSWKPIEAPLPISAGGNTNARLTSVACPSTSSCVAVGYYTDTGSIVHGLILTGWGSSWSPTSAPLPTGADPMADTYLNSVACPSTTSCVAVGSYNSSFSNSAGALLESGAGTLWTPTQAPLPLNAFSAASLYAVTCPSSTTCVAAGHYTDVSGASQGLLETGAVTDWVPDSVPLPANADTTNPNVSLGSSPIACPSATSCVVVGQYVNSSGYWNGVAVTGLGTSWTPVQAAVPANAHANAGSDLSSVACRSAASCVATGNYGDSSGHTQGLALTGLGTSWTPAETPLPPDNQGNPEVQFDSATCPSTNWCVNAGTYAIPDGAVGSYQGLAVAGVGTSWNATEAPLPGTNTLSLGTGLSVACPSTTSCTAVGGYDSGYWTALVATGAP